MGKKSRRKSEPKPVRIDLGCGKNPKPGFIGADVRDFGQPVKADLTKRWPWANESVDEAVSSHFVEHLEPAERIHFVNELYRVLKKGCAAQIIAPHWASCRSYGDLTHKWPPVSEFWFYYLSKAWRETNAPHNDEYECDFVVTWGYALPDYLQSRNQEFQQFALQNYKEAASDVIATFKKP